MNKSYLFLGRFQPFHNGHLRCIQEMIKDGRVLIAICSAQESWTMKNPFTASERYEMIWEAIQQNMLSAYVTIIPLVDVTENHVWVNYVKSMVPTFNVVYSNNPLSRALFMEANYPIIPEKPERSWLSSTEIRDKMVADGDWESMVPNPVAEYIFQKKLIERVKVVYNKE